MKFHMQFCEQPFYYTNFDIQTMTQIKQIADHFGTELDANASAKKLDYWHSDLKNLNLFPWSSQVLTLAVLPHIT